MSDLIILGYRVPGGRETVARAAHLALELNRAGEEAHAIAVSADEVEVWITQPSAELAASPPEFKGVEFTGVVTPERSRAHKAWVHDQEMRRAEAKIRSLHRDSLYLSQESMHVDSWWMNTGPVE